MNFLWTIKHDFTVYGLCGNDERSRHYLPSQLANYLYMYFKEPIRLLQFLG